MAQKSIFTALILVFLFPFTTPAQDHENVQLVSQLFHDWNSAEAVSIDDDYAYVLDLGVGMHIVNISRPTSPRQVATFTYEDPAYDVAAANGYAFITAGSDGLVVVDATDPAEPEEVTVVGEIGDARGVTVYGNRAYVAAGADGMVILNVANPRSPQFLGGIDTPGFAVNVKVVGNFAYVADRREGLRIINVQNPAEPEELGSIEPMGETRDVTFVWNHLFTADTRGLSKIDLTNPDDPQRVDYVELPSPGLAIDHSTDYIHVATGNDGLRMYYIHADFDEREPIEACNFAVDVVISGDNAYVASRGSGLRVLSLANPAEPVEIGCYGINEYLNCVAVSGDYAFLGNVWSGGITEVNISNPSAPYVVWRNSYRRYCADIAIYRRYLYMVDNMNSYLRIADISNPENPQWLSVFNLRYGPTKITISMPFLYIGTDYGGTHIIDVSDPADPVRVGIISTENRQNHFEAAVSGDFAFVATYSSGLKVVNVADPMNPREIAVYQPDQTIRCVKIRGDFAFLGHYHFFEVVDISNPREPEIIDSLEMSRYPVRITLTRDLALLSLQGDGFHIVDISDPADLHEVGYYDTPGCAYDIAVSGNLAFVADGQHFGIYDFWDALNAPEDSPSPPVTFVLDPAYPNPFNASTTITYRLPYPSNVSLTVYNPYGRKVGMLVDEQLAGGIYTATWQPDNLASGLYFVRLEVPGQVLYSKLMLIK